jgi:hypothetical protein
VRRCCLVDPVCFWSVARFGARPEVTQNSLYEPDVPYAFLYGPVRSGIEILMRCAPSGTMLSPRLNELRYFVARELGTANTLHRHFDCTCRPTSRLLPMTKLL